MKKSLWLALLLSCATLLSACDYLASFTRNIQQGNILEEKEVVQLKTGMTKAEVTRLIGYPVYENTFDNKRWVYVYTSLVGRRDIKRKKVILTFKGNRLRAIERG